MSDEQAGTTARAAHMQSGAERIADLFVTARREDRSVFLPFLTAGLPDPASSPRLFQAMAEAGADGFEVGIPYSDPLMDGPVICRGSEQAIAAGATLDESLSILGEVAETTALPSLAMTYANPVFRRNADWFCDRLAEAGAAGMIVADLPFEEARPLSEAARRYGLGMVLFVALTSGYDRIRAVAEAEPAFIYAVANLGVTGGKKRMEQPGGGTGGKYPGGDRHSGGVGSGDLQSGPGSHSCPVGGRLHRRNRFGSPGSGIGQRRCRGPIIGYGCGRDGLRGAAVIRPARCNLLAGSASW